MQIQQALDELNAHPEVIGASLWDKVPGKARIYVETRKHNGGHAWNGGKGYRICYIDLHAKRLFVAGKAGAATRKRLAPLVERMTEIAAEIEG